MKTRIVMLTATALVFGSHVGFASGRVEAQTLKGVKSVYVLVEEIGEGGKKIGLTEAAIRTDAELKLRLAGIKVLTEEEYYNDALGPYLYININVIADASGGLAESVDVSFKQQVYLARDNSLVDAITWRTGRIGSFPTEAGTRTSVKDMVDRFLNDWLSVNPK